MARSCWGSRSRTVVHRPEPQRPGATWLMRNIVTCSNSDGNAVPLTGIGALGGALLSRYLSWSPLDACFDRAPANFPLSSTPNSSSDLSFQGGRAAIQLRAAAR